MEKWLFMQLFKVDLVNFLTSKDWILAIPHHNLL